MPSQRAKLSGLATLTLLIACPGTSAPTLDGRVVLDGSLEDASEWHRTVHDATRACLAREVPKAPVTWSEQLDEHDSARWHSWMADSFMPWASTPCPSLEVLSGLASPPAETLGFALLHQQALVGHSIAILQGIGIPATVHGCDGDLSQVLGGSLQASLELAQACAAELETAPSATKAALEHCEAQAVLRRAELSAADERVCEIALDPEF